MADDVRTNKQMSATNDRPKYIIRNIQQVFSTSNRIGKE